VLPDIMLRSRKVMCANDRWLQLIRGGHYNAEARGHYGRGAGVRRGRAVGFEAGVGCGGKTQLGAHNEPPL
jgi:hypothetical protein